MIQIPSRPQRSVQKCLSKWVSVALLLFAVSSPEASTLTDYGAVPALSKPPSDQSAANEKLDFHTDLFTGRFTYRIPIVVPPARQGSEPSIALQYNSSGGNGWCGVGWELELGYVQRETRRGVPATKFGYSDSAGFIFSAAGQSGRLVLASDGSYRPEINTAFLKFTFASGYWVATDKSGRKYTFGDTSSSRIDNLYGSFKWGLSSIRDANGNQTTISYQTVLPADGQLYLNQIAYNANNNSPALSANCTVTFALESTARSDMPSSLISGSEVYTSRRLQTITVANNGNQVRRYVLSYTNSPSTGRSLLSQVTENGTDANWAFPPLTFTYSQQNPSFQPTNGWALTSRTFSGDPSGICPGTPDAALIDINGDGLPDWVTTPNGVPFNHFNVQLNTGSGFGSVQSWSTLTNEANFVSQQWNTINGSESGGSLLSELADINGDGLPDRIMRQASAVNNTYDHFQVQTNNGTGFSSLRSWGGITNQHTIYTNTVMNDMGVTVGSGVYTIAVMSDMNGDGLPDRVMLGHADGTFDVQTNKQGSFGPIISWTNVAGAVGQAGNNAYAPRCRDATHVYSELIDMNGDGLPDRAIQGKVYLNNGFSGFTSTGLSWGFGSTNDPEVVDVTSGKYTQQLIDMNGDGLPDLVTANSNATFVVRFNTGRGGFSGSGVIWSGVDTNGGPTLGWDAMQAWNDIGTKVLFIDMNGDGLVDRVIRNYAGGTDRLLVQLNTGPFPDLMINVNNGIGGYVAVTYTPATSYDNSDGTRPRLAMPIYTVSSVAVDEGIRTEVFSATTTYTYRQGLYDTTYREFRGFGIVDEVDPLGTTNETWFYQGGGANQTSHGEYADSRFKAGMPFDSITFGSDGLVYNETRSQVDEMQVDANGVYFPYVKRRFTLTSEGTGHARTRLEEFAYDVVSNNISASTGNLLTNIDHGEVTNVNYSYTFSAIDSPVFTTYQYTNIGSNPDIIDHPQSATISSDSSGSSVLRQATYQYYDVTGDLKQKSERICSGSFATTTYSYDVYGNLTGTTDPVGIITAADYDSSATFPLRKYTGPLSSNLVEYFRYDSRSGALAASTNRQGLVTSNSYDGLLRLTNTVISTNPNGTPTLWRTRYQYSLGGVLNNICSNYVRVSKNDPSDPANGSHDTYNYFDGVGRVIQVRDESETNGTYRVSDTFFDPRGNVTVQNYPLFGSGTAFTVPTGTRTNVYIVYDPVGRPVTSYPCAKATVDSAGTIISNSLTSLNGDPGSPVGPNSIAFHDGNNPWSTVVTDARGKVHKYFHDGFGRTNQIVEVTSNGNYNSWLSYDSVGNLTNLTDSASNQISFYYNDLGEKVAEADPDRGYWQFGLDAAGRLKVQTDAKNNILLFDYSDPAGRLKTRLGYNPQGGLASTVTNYYDGNLGDSAYTVYPGQLFMTSDDEGWTKHSYDVRGREVKTVRYLSKNGQTYTSLSTFDDADRATTMTYPNAGPTVTNIFDLAGHLCQVKLVGGAGTLYYDAKGFNELAQLTGINFGNGAVSTFNYYKASKRLNQITTTAGGTTVQNLTNRYDAVGNILGVQDLVTGHTGAASATMTNAVYDDLNRLVSAGWTGYGLKAYAYDKIGNVLTNGESGNGAYTYGSVRPHLSRSANNVWFTADQNGNVVFRGGQRLEYDVNNQLKLVLNTNGVLTTFGYGAGGERLWEASGTNSLQVWNGSDYEEKNGQVLYHIFAGGRLVCTFDRTGTNVFQYYHPDSLTSTSVQTDQNGGVVQHYEYSAFGQTRYTLSSSSFPVSRRYTSQVLDEATGLYYYNFRYYDPQLGRFVQPDDIIPELANPQSYNKYSYCLGNPLRFTDPTGHETYLEGVGNVFLGYYDAGAGVVKGTVFVVAHPIRTGEGLVSAALHPIETGKAIGNGIVEDWNSGTRGQGKLVGGALIAIGTIVAPAAEAGNLSKVSEVANVAPKVERAAAAAEKTEAAVHRVATPGKPQFQLRQGEKGLSVFDAAKVKPEEILPHFREGSQVTTKSATEIQSHGLTLEKTPGHPNLPQHLQDAHMEIRPGANMTRNEFKQAIKNLEPKPQ